MTNQHLETIREDVIYGRATEVDSVVQKALDQGLAPETILNQALILAMNEVGERFEKGEFYVPEMLIAARAMKTGLKILQPSLVDRDIKPVGKFVIGTVQGDLHDIGKNLVAMMIEGAGFEVIDLGTDVAPERFVDAARGGADIIGLSALLTTTMANMQGVLNALSEAEVRGRCKVIIGGAPVTKTFADEIGADGYAPDASQAVSLARSILEIPSSQKPAKER